MRNDPIGNSGWSGTPTKVDGTNSVTDLRTIQQAKLLFALSNGQIQGPVHPSAGLKDIYLNDIPVQNLDGTMNFNGLAVAMTSGTLTQVPIPGFSDTESLTASGAQITNASPQTISIPNGGPTAVRINLSMPGLYFQDSGTGQMNSDIVQIQFLVSNNGGGFVDITSAINPNGVAISGVSTGAVARSYRIPLAPYGTGPWSVKVVRITPDNGTAYRVNGTYLQSYATITEQALTYPKTALLSLCTDASRFASVPKVSIRARGIQVQVPANYTPASKGSVSLGNVTATMTATSVAVDGSAKTFTRATGDFVADGFAVGQTITTWGFTNPGNNSSFLISGISTTVITCTAATGLVTEASAAGRGIVANVIQVISVDGAAKTFTRATGSFLTDGFAVGQTILTNGFTNAGNNTTLTLSGVTATVLTCSTTTSLVTELAGTGRTIATAWVPAVYATTGPGTTGGSWDGTFKTSWSSNPAWVFYDMATNPVYGCGKYLGAAGINKWLLYQIAQYCDGMISDGFGGLEPRFTFNGYLTTQDEAFKVLAHIISCARAQLYYGGGQATPIQDVDGSPVMLFTRSNVQDGQFSYQGTARKARHTIANVFWNDPNQEWNLVPESVNADDASISRYGIQTSSLTAFGCTSRGQARRMGRALLLSELNELEGVTFTTGLEGIVARPGDLILIQDPGRKQVRQGGRTITGSTTTSINLDAPVTLVAGAYTLYVQLQDGSVASSTVTNSAGTWQTLTVGSAFASAPLAQAQWLLTSASVTATRWRVVSVKETQDTNTKSYTITAIANYQPKYALLDATDTLVAPSAVPVVTFAAPTGLVVSSSTNRAQADRLVYTLAASWTSVSGATGYTAQYQTNGGLWQDMVVAGCSASMVDVPIGVYNLRICANFPVGSSSFTVLSGFAVTNAGTSPAEVAQATASAALPATGTAADSAKLGGVPAANYATTASVPNLAAPGTIGGTTAGLAWFTTVNASTAYRVGGTQVLGTQQTGLGATLASTHCGATYTTTEQGLINALIDKVVILETKLKAHGLVAT